jgi:hypothetical protein
MKPKRLVDIDGYIINEPEHYHESLRWGREMVDSMEHDNVDRSDMLVIINRLSEEMRFCMAILKDREAPNEDV